MIKVAVTEKEFNKAKRIFENADKNGLMCLAAPSEENELASFVAKHQINHVIVGVEPYRAKLYTTLKPGSLIARFGVGVDNINQKLASEKNIYCTNTPDALTNCVAEHAVALMLTVALNIPKMVTEFERGNWQPQMGFELSGKNLVIIGAGKIGSRLAQIANIGFQMNVTGVYNSIRRNFNSENNISFMKLITDFKEAVRDADFISLHLPIKPDTHHYLNKEKINMLPSKTWIVNTARGGLIDESALFEALSLKKIAGACLDVFEKEPYMPSSQDKDFRKLNNVILTPHVGSTTNEACQKMATICLKNILLLEKGLFAEMNLLNNNSK